MLNDVEEPKVSWSPLIVSKVWAGVPTGRAPRTSLTIEHLPREQADHPHITGSACGLQPLRASEVVP